jgi:hypothetical protein
MTSRKHARGVQQRIGRLKTINKGQESDIVCLKDRLQHLKRLLDVAESERKQLKTLQEIILPQQRKRRPEDQTQIKGDSDAPPLDWILKCFLNHTDNKMNEKIQTMRQDHLTALIREKEVHRLNMAKEMSARGAELNDVRSRYLEKIDLLQSRHCQEVDELHNMRGGETLL